MAEKNMDDTSEVVVSDGVETAHVRRAPKYSVFLLLGAAIGVFIAMILTFAFDGQPDPRLGQTMQFSQSQIFGFLALICGVIGLGIGGIIAITLDRTVGRRTRRVSVEREEHLSID